MKHFFLGGRGAWLKTPLRDRARGTGPSLAVNTIDDEGYVNSVQPPLSEIAGSAPEMPFESVIGRLRLLLLVIGSKIWRQIFNQREEKSKSIAAIVRAIFPALWANYM